MSDRRVKVTFEANVGGYKKGMEEAASATEKLAESAEAAGKSSDKQKAALKTLAPAAMVAGAGLVAGVGMAITKFASFDKAMSNVQAATHETTGNMALLREAAMTAGADTAFSADEAAKGIEELAKAGVSTADIMGGGLTGALSLAAAGELAVGDAAEIAATAMTQFKLSGDQIPHLADLLAAGAGKAQGSVTDLGAALNQSGLVASAAGLNIEETTGTLAAFASAGLLGSDAGTSFKSMLQRLQNPSKKAALEMEELGINMYDANGEFAGMDVLAGQLATSLGNKSSAERDAAMATIFGSDAVRAANVLYAQGAEGIQDWTAKVNDAGYAAKTAAIMQDNLAGDLELLGGAFDTVFLKAGGTGNDALRGFVQAAEGVVDAIGKIPAPIMGIGTIMAGVAGGALLIGGGLITAIPKIKDTVDALKDIAPAGSKADKSLRGVGKAAAYTAGAVGALSIVGPTIASWVSDGLSADPSKLAAELRNIGSGGKDAELGLAGIEAMFNTGGKDFFSGLDVGGLEDAFRIMGNPNVSDNVDNTLSSILSFGTRGSSNIEFAKKNFSELDAQLSSMVSNGMADQAGTAYETLAQKALDAGVPIEKLVEIFPGYNSALAQNSTAAAAAVGANEETASALDEVGLAANGAVESMDKFLESLFAAGLATMSSKDAAFQWADSLRDMKGEIEEVLKTQKKLGPVLEKGGKDFNKNTDSGAAALELFHGKLREGMAVAETYAKDTSKSQEDVQEQLTSTYKAGVKAAEGFGMGTKEAEALVRAALEIPKGVDIETWISDEAKRGAEETTGAIEAIPGYKKVEVVVSEDGTAGQVQSKVNEVTGKTEYILVSEDGTTAKVQAGIANIKGKDVPVWVDDNGTVYTTGGKIQGIKGKSVTIVADAETAAAEAALNNAARDRSSVISTRVVTTKVTHESTGVGGRGGLTRASGGSVFGAGTETSDSIPAWLSNNEHVLSAKEVRGLGGHSAVERLRSRARSGDLPAFKDGGAVGSYTIKRGDTLSGIAKQFGTTWRELQRINKIQNADRIYAGQTLDLPGGGASKAKAKPAPARTYSTSRTGWAEKERDQDAREVKAATAALTAAKRTKNDKKIATAEKNLDKAKKSYDESKERVVRLREKEFDLRRDLKRGNILDAFTSGSGMTVVDQLFDQSNNKDLSSKQRSVLRSTAYSMESQLLKLEKQTDKLSVSFGNATARRDELLSVQRGVQSGMVGAFDLGGLAGQQDAYGYDSSVGKKGLLNYGKSMASGAKKLSSKVASLQKAGFHASMIEQVISEWTGAGTFELADAMLSMNKNERSSFNNSFKSVERYGLSTGASLTNAMAKGGINAAEGLVKGLESQQKKVDNAFHKLGKDAEKAFKRSLGIKSPSTVMFGAGVNVGEGAELGILSKVSDVQGAMGRLAEVPAFSVPPSAEVARYAAQPAAAAGVVIDYDRLAQAMTNVQLRPVVSVDRKTAGQMVDVGNKFNGTHR